MQKAAGLMNPASRAVVLLLAVLYCSKAAADPALVNGTAVTGICATCCSNSRYCAQTAAAGSIANGAGGLATGTPIPAGTTQTCYLQDRSQPGAVDAGLCIPNLGLSGNNLNSFCKAQAGGALVTSTIYQVLSPTPANVCQPCCYGNAACGTGLACYALTAGSGGLCVPTGLSASSIPSFCPTTQVSATSILTCDSCASLSPNAQALSNTLPPSSAQGPKGN